MKFGKISEAKNAYKKHTYKKFENNQKLIETGSWYKP